MNVTLFSDHPLASNSIASVVVVECELVLETEAQIVSKLLPRVRFESVALNLSRVERMDAAGIAALLTLYCAAAEAGTDFSVIAPSPHVLETLRIVGLESVLVAGSRPRGAACPCLDRPAA
jgi:anti-anti-sigma factor